MPSSIWKRLSAVPAAALLLMGCSPEEPRAGQADTVSEAQQFGDIRLPGDAEVIGAKVDSGGPDTIFRLAIKTTPEGADHLVQESNLSAGRPTQPSFVIFTRSIVGGPELKAGPGVQSWQDRITNGDGDLVSRSITVDARESPVVYVHLVIADVS